MRGSNEEFVWDCHDGENINWQKRINQDIDSFIHSIPPLSQTRNRVRSNNLRILEEPSRAGEAATLLKATPLAPPNATLE